MKEKPIIAYLFSKYDLKKNIFNFIKHYKKYKSGHKHDLIICLKQNSSKKLKIVIEKKLSSFKFKFFIDNEPNDYDWGSYNRIAKKYKNRIIFFFNCHSYPIKHNWLKFFSDNFNSKSVLAPTGSYQSISQSSFNGFYFKNFFLRLFHGISNIRYFNLFPNPHLRSNCFMVSANEFLKLDLIFCKNKIDTWKNESGKNGMTKQFQKKNFKLLVINDEGKSFDIRKWKESETYAFKKQSKLLISDKHTREFDNFKKNYKNKYIENIWGV